MKKQVLAFCLLSALVLSACHNATDAQEKNTPATSDSSPQTATAVVDKTAFDDMDMPTITFGDSGYSSAPVAADADGFALDTTIHIRLFAKDKDSAKKAMRAAFSEVNRFNRIFSATTDSGEIARLNKTGEGTLSPEVLALFDKALQVYDDTGGAYNVALYPVSQLWGFPTGDYRKPDEAALQAALPLTNPHEVRVNPQTGSMRFTRAGMGLDFDGISQGALSDRLMDVLQDAGISSGLVNIDGNVQVLHRHPDKTDFRVGIQDPSNDTGYIGSVDVNNKAVITTGDYQRSFEADGQSWHSILNPQTGMPAENGLNSVSVIAQNGATASALSRALYVLGPKEAIAYWQKHAKDFDMVLYYKDGQVAVTGGIAKHYTANNRPQPDMITAES